MSYCTNFYSFGRVCIRNLINDIFRIQFSFYFQISTGIANNEIFINSYISVNYNYGILCHKVIRYNIAGNICDSYSIKSSTFTCIYISVNYDKSALLIKVKYFTGVITIMIKNRKFFINEVIKFFS